MILWLNRLISVDVVMLKPFMNMWKTFVSLFILLLVYLHFLRNEKHDVEADVILFLYEKEYTTVSYIMWRSIHNQRISYEQCSLPHLRVPLVPDGNFEQVPETI